MNVSITILQCVKKKRRMINLNLKEHLEAQNKSYAEMIRLMSEMILQNTQIIEHAKNQEKAQAEEPSE